MPVPVPHQRAVVLPHQAGPVDDACADTARVADAPGAGDTTAQGLSAPATAVGRPSAPLGSHGFQKPEQPQPAAQPVPADHPPAHQGLTLLLIGEDPNSHVPDMWDWAGRKVRLRTARNLTEAGRLLTDDVHCILLDLPPRAPGDRTERDPSRGDAPDDELGMLRDVLRMATSHAVLVLTYETDAERAADAVRVGAQDYLFRDELDGAVLSRAVRYAVERKRADLAQRQLTESRMLAQENARLERGLLPTPLLDGSNLRFAACYRPGRSRALLGGDFYDTVRTPDGTVHAMIGDVCGHGPDEAALGVELRIAWRALTFAGLSGDELLATLQKVLEHERADDEIFATLCTVDISADGRRAGLCLAGHPAPLLAQAGRPPQLLPYEFGGPALGLLPHARWPRRQVELGGSWSLMMYTDGLIEGRIGQGNQRLGQEGMTELVSRQMAAGLTGEELLEASVREVRDLNGGELTDDVAVLLLDRR
ncbi:MULTISPECIES: PP2C family protein-serine/threonine phosphatase [unclassified Streptomyces]|uniref:PP2C family protein-serine/threonine phosphatase n=1 Tax=unclassified Streptomyces TaxID=2593676 RepID=UPI00087E1515|nr:MULTISPECIES: PP2C family protein-serine/threonine phosphatase [unclassified Streptomyces]PBC84192.1 serine phosphatase RsbU (regulator of sigma subunit) [Streptomyces sp. 2321.6]SDR33978.1 Serine phosphatase RsbU, regulator of sigma subunit [Streptomyces sp. KS_16]SED22927.1 Serine phosphatase RsbU, regulator of sigma subunit [Streptomyces sp. 2133.1]SNC70274.1 Serine phosphatase RsbU, regulator of sigma subunit [Streptomyces sp. 2114.4]